MFSYRNILQSPFLKHVATLSSGTAIAQAIAIGLLPVLTRLYSPEDFGVLTLYISIASLFFIFGSLRYEVMIMLPRTHKSAAQLVRLVFFISIIASFISLLLVVFFRHQIATFFGNPEVAPWLFFLPVSLFFQANYQALRYWTMRLKKFGVVSQGMVIKTSTNFAAATTIKAVDVPLIAGGGLVIGAILADIVNAAWLFFRCKKRDRVLFERVRKNRLSNVAKRHGSMAATLTISHGIAVVNSRLPSFMISGFFGSAALGFFGVAERIASAPSQLIASAIGDVYRQRASVLYRETGRFDQLMIKTLMMTFALAIVPYAVGIIFAPDIFRIALGAEWEEAGRYASIIMVSGFFSFVITPTDKWSVIVNAKRYIIIMNIYRFVAYSISGLVTIYFQLGILLFLFFIVISNILFYFAELLFGYLAAQGRIIR